MDTEGVTSQDSGFTYRYVAADQAALDRLKVIVPASAGRVNAFLGLPYVSSIEVVVYPNRAQFVAKMREIWNLPGDVDVECWAIATAGRAGIYLLSPRVWQTEACGHSDSTEHLTGVVAHELVHVLHVQQQRAQLPNETLFMTTRWIIEGLAVYASGQIEREYASQARSRFAAGFAPHTFVELYDDPAFYGLAGSLVGYIDRHVRTSDGAGPHYGEDERRRIGGARNNGRSPAQVVAGTGFGQPLTLQIRRGSGGGQ